MDSSKQVEEPGAVQIPEITKSLAKTHWFPSNSGDISVKTTTGALANFPLTKSTGDASDYARILATTSSRKRFQAYSIRFAGEKKSPKHSVPPPFASVGIPDLRICKPSLRRDSPFAFSPDAVAEVILQQLGLLIDTQTTSNTAPNTDRQKDRNSRKIDTDFANLAIPKLSQDQESVGSLLAEDVQVGKSGLIVIAGSTGTGKSTYAKAIAIRYLLRLAAKRVDAVWNRAVKEIDATEKKTGEDIEAFEKAMAIGNEEANRQMQASIDALTGEPQKVKLEEIFNSELAQYSPPNFVTFEDPIEGWAFEGLAENGSKSTKVDLCEEHDSDLNVGIRIIAREKGDDVQGDKEQAAIKIAYRDALRQKPDLFYIGECRSQHEWETAIELGATGHLVITTCHSSSLIDTFIKLAGRDSRDAQSRRLLANSLLGVIHLQKAPLENLSEHRNLFPRLAEVQTLFHMWRNRNTSVSNFVVDGLSSLISDNVNTISRQRMNELILELQKNKKLSFDVHESGAGDNISDNSESYDTLLRILNQAAGKLDRQGL